MGTYFLLKERKDDLPLEEIECSNRTGAKWTMLYNPKVKFDSFTTKDDYDIKWLYSIMSKFMYADGLDAHSIYVEYGFMADHPGYHRPIDIPKYVEAAKRILTDEDELQVAFNTLAEFEKNPNLYWFISY